MNDRPHVLAELMSVIQRRKAELPANSYTTRLFQGGVPKIGEKITEEAAEVVEAAGESGPDGQQHLVCEAGDLIYHLLVMLAMRGASLDDVECELAHRFGVSGLDEKAARQQPKEES